MTQQIIDVGAAANDGTGEPLRDAFNAVNDNFTQIWTAGPVGSQVQITGNIVTTTVTNLGLTLAGNGIGNITANSTIVPGTPSVYDLGGPDNKFQYIYGDYFVGNGAMLTGIAGTYSNADVAAFLPTYTGNLVSLTGPVRTTANVIAGNIITSGFLGVSGNITGGNITGTNLLSSGYVSATGNIYGGVINATGANIAGNISILGNILTSNISASGNVTADTITANSFLGGTLLTTGAVSAAGNITAPYFFGNGAGLTGLVISGGTEIFYGQSNVKIGSANANVVVGVNGTPNIATFSTSGLGITGVVSATGNVIGGNVVVSGQVTAAGNVAANYFIGNGSLLTGLVASNVNANTLVGSTLSANVLNSTLQTVGNLLFVNVNGNVTTTGRFIGSGAGLTGIPGANVTGAVANATYATSAGTVATAAQPNITSVGTLTSLSSTGNITANYFLGNGSQLTGVTASSVAANALIGTTLSSNVVYSSLLSVGALNSLSVVGNTIGGSFSTAGNISAVGNVTGNYFIGNGRQLTGIVATSVGVLSNLSVTGNIVTGNLNTSGIISATGNIRTTGNIAGNYFIGNGSQLTGITVAAGTSIVNGNSNVSVGGNGNVTVGVTGTSNVAVFSTEGVSVAGLVSATGNISGNYILGNGAFLSGLPVQYGNSDVANYLPTYTGNLVSLNGPVTTTSNVTGGNLLTDGIVSATGNVIGDYILGNGALLTGVITSVANINNGTSNITVVSSGGNITVGIGGTSNVVQWATTGEYVTGVVSASGNVTGANIVTSGNVTGANVVSATILSATANIAGGNVQTSGQVTATGNITGGNLLTGGSVSAVGNIAGNYFIGNGSQLTGVAASSVNANALVGNTLSSNVLYSSLTQVGTLANLAVTGNITGGNITTSGSGGNISGANVISGTTLSATANVVGGNITSAGLITATGNATAGNVLTSGQVSATSNITGGNITTAGLVSTNNFSITGDITGNIIPSANVTYDIGNATHAFKDLYLSGNSIYIGAQTISSNATGITVGTGDLAGSNVNVSNAVNAGTTISAVGNITGGNVLTSGVVSATGNATAGNVLTSGLVSATGNATAGNVLTAGQVSATANITGGNVLTSGLVSATGTITSAANIAGANLITSGLATITGNVTGGNLLTGGLISASGNITGNNVFASGVVSVAGNVIAGNINTSTIAPVSGGLTIATATGNLNLQPAGNIVLANTIINSLAYPLQDTDAASKLYVDNMVSTGLAYHTPVAAATTTTLATTTGGTITYAQPNGVANGVGATLTTTGSFNLIDTANVQTVGTRILVKNEGNAVYNGVYTWSNATVIVRSTDTDEYGPDSTADLSLNDYFFVQGGNVNKGGAWVVSAPSGTITFGTSNITFSQFSSSQTYTANTDAGISLIGTQINAKVDQNTTAFDGTGNIIVKAGANLTTPNIGAATGTSVSLVGNAISGNVLTSGVVSSTGTVTGGNLATAGTVSATGNVTGNYILGNGSQLTGILGSNVNMGSNTAGQLVSNAVTLTTATTVTNGIALLNQVLGKLVPPAPPNFPNSTSITLSGISSYRMANITQVDNTPGANKAVAAGTTVANVLRVATYATNTIATTGPGDAGTIVAVRNGANVGSVTLNAGASPSGNGTYGSNLVISNNYDYHTANANITAGFWYVFSAAVSGSSASAGWNELYIADTSTANTNTTVWYYDNSSPSAPSFSSTTMTPPGSANLLYSSTIPHYTNNNNFTISFNVANVSGNMYPTSNVLASGSAGGAFAAPASINYSASNIGSNVLSSFASASANTTASITTGFGGSLTGPSMTVNNSYSTGTLTLTTALGNAVLWKSGTATAIDESNVVINTTIGTGSGNAYRIINPGTGNTPAYTGSEAAFNSQTSTLQTYDATVVGSGTSGVLKHDQTNYSTGYLPAGPNLSSGRTGTQYFTMKFVRTAVSKFDIKYSGNIAGMWVALPGSVIDSSSSANGWINMAVAYAGAGYPGVNSPGNGSDGCSQGGTVTLNTTVTNSSKTCTFGTVSSSSTSTNEIYVRIALTAGQTVTALTLETASN